MFQAKIGCSLREGVFFLTFPILKLTLGLTHFAGMVIGEAVPFKEFVPLRIECGPLPKAANPAAQDRYSGVVGAAFVDIDSDNHEQPLRLPATREREGF